MIIAVQISFIILFNNAATFLARNWGALRSRFSRVIIWRKSLRSTGSLLRRSLRCLTTLNDCFLSLQVVRFAVTHNLFLALIALCNEAIIFIIFGLFFRLRSVPSALPSFYPSGSRTTTSITTFQILFKISSRQTSEPAETCSLTSPLLFRRQSLLLIFQSARRADSLFLGLLCLLPRQLWIFPDVLKQGPRVQLFTCVSFLQLFQDAVNIVLSSIRLDVQRGCDSGFCAQAV